MSYQSRVKTVDTLPDVHIDVPLLDLPDGKIVWPTSSPWNNADREFALGVMTTAAVRNGKTWAPVHLRTIMEIVEKSPWSFFRNDIVAAISELSDEGLLELVLCEGEPYVIPTQEFAQTLQKCGGVGAF